jgi:hypothetical protein
MKDHCSIAAAGQRQGNTFFRRSRNTVLGFGQFRWHIIVLTVTATFGVFGGAEKATYSALMYGREKRQSAAV